MNLFSKLKGRLDRVVGGIYSGDKDLTEVVSGTVVTMVLKVLGVGLGFVFIYVLSAWYGEKAVGVYTLSLSVIMVGATLGTFGFNNAILRFSAQYGLTGDWGVLRDAYRRMARISFVASAVLAVVLVLAAGAISEMLLKKTGSRAAFMIAGAAVPFFAMSNINFEALRGIKRIKESEFFKSVSTVFLNFTLFLAAVYAFGFTLELPVATYGVAVFLTFLLSTALFWSISGKGVAKTSTRLGTGEIFKVSGPMYATMILTLVMDNTVVFILGYFRGPEEVGVYAVAMRLSMITAFLLTAINSIIAPKMAELFWSGRPEDLKKIIRFSSKTLFWSSAPASVAFIAAPAFFMGLFGTSFKAGAASLAVLSLGQFVNAACGSVGCLLNMTDRQSVLKTIMFLAAVINVAGCFVLVPLWGVFGAAVAVSLSLASWNIIATAYIRISMGFNTFYLPFLKERP